MNYMSVRIETENLLLLPLTYEYFSDIRQEFTAPITKYMLPKPNAHPAETLSFLESSMGAMKLGFDLQLAILDKKSQEFFGCCGLHNLQSGHPEIGLWLKMGAHGHHYGREAVGGLISWARNNIAYAYLIYPVDQRNIPSRHIPEHFGGNLVRRYKVLNEVNFELDVFEYHIPGDPTLEAFFKNKMHKSNTLEPSPQKTTPEPEALVKHDTTDSPACNPVTFTPLA